jgi:CubicO group peptidase (beta-lactamase class C family)
MVMRVGKEIARKRTSIAALTLVLTMLAPMSVMAAPASSSSDLTFDATKKIVAEKAKLLTETYGTTSLQYALIDHGKITVSGHAGKNDLKNEVPLTSNTIYGIGSTSKMILTAAVMKLVDDGKLDLDVPVVTYIPDFTMRDSRHTQITPRMLLNHSSGLHGYIGPNSTLFDDHDTYAHDTLLEELAAQDLQADPGAYSVYNNVGFSLAEILVERVSGMDFTVFIHKYFTVPLQMNNTKTPQDIVNPATLAGVYHPNYEGQLPTENYNVIASGGVYSTAEDLAAFSRIFTGEVDGILSPKSVKAMEQAEYKRGMWPPEEADSSLSYGLGWDSVNLFPFNQYGIKAITKGGDTASYHSSLVVLPEYNMSAAVVSSGGSSATDQLLANELLLSALQEIGIIKERKPEKSHGMPIKANMPQELSQHAGLYGGAAGAIMKVEMNPVGELAVSTITAPNLPHQKLTYTTDGSFVNEDGSQKYKFVVEKNGRTYLWSRSYISIPKLGQIAISEYKAEKLEANELLHETAAAWKEREYKKYYVLSEKYSSMTYFNAKPILQLNRVKDAPGYLLNFKIMDANKAANKLQIPPMAGRDSMELNFFKKNGVEYFTLAGGLYAGEEFVKPLYSGKDSSTTIETDGYAKWFSIPTAVAGKFMTVTMPSNSSFAVYDQAGICINHTVVSGKNQVVLPGNGRVVFAGEVGSIFEISLKKE